MDEKVILGINRTPRVLTGNVLNKSLGFTILIQNLDFHSFPKALLKPGKLLLIAWRLRLALIAEETKPVDIISIYGEDFCFFFHMNLSDFSSQ